MCQFDNNHDKMESMVPVSMPKAPTSPGVSSPPPAAGSQAAHSPRGLPPVAGLVRTRQCLVQASIGSVHETSPAGIPQAVDFADSSSRFPRWAAGSLDEPTAILGSPEGSMPAAGAQLLLQLLVIDVRSSCRTLIAFSTDMRLARSWYQCLRVVTHVTRLGWECLARSYPSAWFAGLRQVVAYDRGTLVSSGGHVF